MQYIRVNVGKMAYQRTEQINALRSNIQFSGKDRKVFLVTSCLQGEGKSTTSLQLSKSLADLGKNVLYIDADLRASVVVGKIEGEKPTFGLSHLLSGQSTVKDTVCKTNIEGLYMIVAGPVPPNPTELLSALEFGSLLQALKSIYDYIIIDSAPLGMVVDAAILAEKCDAAILVIESKAIKRKLAQKVKGRLESVGIPILGAVLTKADKKDMGKYYGKEYGENYYSKPKKSK